MENPARLSELEQTAIMAHRIYEEEGCREGRSEEHWARAQCVVHEQRLGVNSHHRDGASADALESPSPMVP